MRQNKSLLNILLLLLPLISLAQTATLKGIILNDSNLPVEGVNIKSQTTGTTTNKNGFYLLKIPANTDVTIEFKLFSTF